MVGVGAVEETRGLLAEDLLLEMAVKKGVGDVHLVHGPRTGDRELKDGADRPGLDNRGEDVGEVDAGTLAKATNHPPRLVTVESTVRMELVLEDPLPGDDVGVRGSGNKRPCLVPPQGVELVLHGRKPLRVAESSPDRGG